jgi:steroid delta-isomerase-like uncharacterized protein
MSKEETRNTVAKFINAIDMTMIANDAVFTMMADSHQTQGREAIQQMIQYFYNIAFEGMHETARMIIVDGYGFVEGFLVGRHIGEFAGIPATGKEVRVPICHIFEVSDGQIQRANIYFQMVTLMQQLGVMPSATPT